MFLFFSHTCYWIWVLVYNFSCIQFSQNRSVVQTSPLFLLVCWFVLTQFLCLLLISLHHLQKLTVSVQAVFVTAKLNLFQSIYFTFLFPFSMSFSKAMLKRHGDTSPPCLTSDLILNWWKITHMNFNFDWFLWVSA